MSRQPKQINWDEIDKAVADAADPLAEAGVQARRLVEEHRRNRRRRIFYVLVGPFAVAAIAVVIVFVVLPKARTTNGEPPTTPAQSTEAATDTPQEPANRKIDLVQQGFSLTNNGSEIKWTFFPQYEDSNPANIGAGDLDIQINPEGAVKVTSISPQDVGNGSLGISLKQLRFDQRAEITVRVKDTEGKSVSVTMSPTVTITVSLDQSKWDAIQQSAPRANSEITLEFVVSNAGSAPATDATFTMPIPHGTEFVQETENPNPACLQGTDGSQNPIVKCQIGQIAGGNGTATPRFTLRAIEAGDIALASACVQADGITAVCLEDFKFTVVAPTPARIELSSDRPFISTDEVTAITIGLLDKLENQYTSPISVTLEVDQPSFLSPLPSSLSVVGGTGTFQITSTGLETTQLPISVTLEVKAGDHTSTTLTIPLAVPGKVQSKVNDAGEPTLPLFRSSAQGGDGNWAVYLLQDQTVLYMISQPSLFWEVQLSAWVPRAINEANTETWNAVTAGGCYSFVSGTSAQPAAFQVVPCERYFTFRESWVLLDRMIIQDTPGSDYVLVWARGWVSKDYVVPR